MNTFFPNRPEANPAVDWPRSAKVAWSQVAKLLHLPGQSADGSTLATQLEKYRHSPDGLTVSGAGVINYRSQQRQKSLNRLVVQQPN